MSYSIDRMERDLRIEALIAPPDQSRASSKWQYLFLNGRFISDRRIGYAIREAFRGLVEHDRYPVVFIFLTTDPDQFDVNVHPTKIEVRWQDAGLVQSQVLAVLRETLLGRDLTPRLRAGAGSDSAAAPDSSPHQQRARQALADYLKSVDPTQARIRFQPPRFPTQGLRPSIASTFAPPFPGSAGLPDFPDRAEGDVGWPSVAALAGRGAHPTTEATGSGSEDVSGVVQPSGGGGIGEGRQGEPPLDDGSMLDRLAAVGGSVLQIHNTYIVAQTDEGIIIVDQHALHERILYEEFRRRILSGPLESQGLLLPESLEVSPSQAQAAEEHQGLLHRLGIEVSTFGPSALAVQSFPTLLEGVEIHAFVADLLDKLAEPGGSASEETLLHAALDMMACKAAVKAGDALSNEEMQALLAQRHLTEKSSNCPHGRPTTLQLSTHDLDKQFKRI